MKIAQVKALVEQVKRHVPEGGKFCVYGHATLVLEGTIPECEFVSFVVDLPTHFHMMKIFGEVETRLEGSWVGNNDVRIYTGYVEARVKMVDGIPCRHEAHPDFDGDMLSGLPLPDYLRTELQERAGNVRKLADILRAGMTEEDGFVKFTDESIQDAMNTGMRQPPNRSDQFEHEQSMKDLARPGVRRPKLDAPVEFMAKGIITADYLSGLPNLEEATMESRSATKALIKPGQPFRTSEYRGQLVKCSQEQLKFNDDPINNRRRFNNASMRVKVTYLRRLAGFDRAVAKESMTARCAPPIGGHIKPEDHTIDSIAVARMHFDSTLVKPTPEKKEDE